MVSISVVVVVDGSGVSTTEAMTVVVAYSVAVKVQGLMDDIEEAEDKMETGAL